MGQKGRGIHHQRVSRYRIQIQAPHFFQGALIKLGPKLEGQFSSVENMEGPYLGKALWPLNFP